jgi:membrane protease YdiL (CAAX protease family)
MKTTTVLSREKAPSYVMTRRRIPTATWTGLFLALFGMLLIRQAFSIFASPSVAAISFKETVIWLSAARLLTIIRRGERLPLTSIGLGTAPWWKSILWGFVIALACLAGSVTVQLFVGLFGGSTVNPNATGLGRLPVALVFLIALRAGIVEELFFRGYALERLQAIGCGRLLASAIPIAIFGLGHWTGGYASVLVALTLGVILTAFYLWRRDLVANMIGHWLVDFVGTVLPRLHG